MPYVFVRIYVIGTYVRIANLLCAFSSEPCCSVPVLPMRHRRRSRRRVPSADTMAITGREKISTRIINPELITASQLTHPQPNKP